MDTNSADELRRHGNLLLAQRNYRHALETFEVMMERFPDDPRGYDGVARALRDLDRNEEVLERLENHAKTLRYPRLLRSVADAARVLHARGNKALLGKAIELHEKYLEVSEDAAACHRLGQLYREGSRDEQAIAAFRRAWDLEHGDASSYKAMLNLLRAQGRHSDIEEAKELWKARNPRRA